MQALLAVRTLRLRARLSSPDLDRQAGGIDGIHAELLKTLHQQSQEAKLPQTKKEVKTRPFASGSTTLSRTQENRNPAPPQNIRMASTAVVSGDALEDDFQLEEEVGHGQPESEAMAVPLDSEPQVEVDEAEEGSVRKSAGSKKRKGTKEPSVCLKFLKAVTVVLPEGFHMLRPQSAAAAAAF